MTNLCSNCEQMKTENKHIRQSLMDTNRNYVEVVNENLELHRKIEELESKYYANLRIT